MGLFSVFSSKPSQKEMVDALIKSKTVQPSISEEFETEKEANDFVIKTMATATFMAGSFKNVPKVTKLTNGKWLGQLYQIPKSYF